MKKTYVTTMPDHIGAFLKASRCFAQLGVNITRVSYNKAVDSHTLFIDAEGTREQLERADEMLTEMLEAAGFCVQGRFAELTTDAPAQDTQRVYYVCKKVTPTGTTGEKYE